MWGECVADRPTVKVRVNVPEPRPAEFSVPKLWKLAVKSQLELLQDSSTQFPVNSKGGNIYLHNIDQVTHIRQMRHIILQAQTQIQFLETDFSSNEDFDFPKCPAPPQRFHPERLAPVRSYGVPAVFSSALKCEKKTKSKEPVALLDRHRAHRITRKAVELSLAHSGFDFASDAAVEVLSDVVGDHMSKLCRLLRAARDDEGLHGSCGFAARWQELKSGSGTDQQEMASDDTQPDDWQACNIDGEEEQTASGVEDLGDPLESNDIVTAVDVSVANDSGQVADELAHDVVPANVSHQKTRKRCKSRSASASSPRKKRKG